MNYCLPHIADTFQTYPTPRLDILLDRHCYIDEHMEELPNLLHLGLTVTTIKSIRCQTNFFPRLFRTLAAPTLSRRSCAGWRAR